jgi:hypothetical protein
MAHHLDFPSHLLLNPLSSFPRVALINPYFLQASKDPFDWFQQELHTLPVLHVGHMDDNFHEQSRRIHEDMTLSA